MSYLLLLLLSALCTNGVHAYLLVTQKTTRKWTISEHAVLHKKAFGLYVLGHLFGGAFFLVFAKLYFVNVAHMDWLFGLTIITVIFEYTQALLPAQGKTIALHTKAALLMWGLFISLGLLCIIFLPTTVTKQLIAGLLYAGLFGTLVRGYSDRERTYKYQMVMVMLFYVSLVVLVA